jgi:AcrR family transcriptional regulator
MSPQTPVTAAPQAGSSRLTQAQRRAHTRAALLSAAGRVFATRGYHDATLEAIATEAGVSKGALYYNFSSKEELFLALLEDRLADRLKDVRDTSSHAGSTASPAIAAERMLRGIERDPRWPPLFFEFVACCARDPELRKRFTERFIRPGREAIAAMVEQHASEAAIDLQIPHHEVATIVHALFNGLLLERLFDPEGAPKELLVYGLAMLEAGMAHRDSLRRASS